MTKLLIIADDLTGATDAGVQRAKHGVRTLVTIKEDISKIANNLQRKVLVVDTQSRHLPPYQAAARVTDVVRQSIDMGITRFYKKIDSTLRGNVGAELEALMSATMSNKLMFIPAHPKVDRFTKDGYQYVGVIPLHSTSFGGDPLEPITESFIPSILARQTDTDYHIVPAEAEQAIAILRKDQSGIYIFDCASYDDLSRIGHLLHDNDALRIMAGPAGFAELLPDLLDLPRALICQSAL